MGNVILEVKDLKVSFYKRRREGQAVRDVNFTLEEGQTLGIIGESGSGKSVSGMSVMGLVPSIGGKIRSGEIIYEGTDLLKLSPKEMRKIQGNKIAMIFQEPMTSLNPVFTVAINCVNRCASTCTCTRRKPKSAPWSCCGWLAFPARKSACCNIRISSPAGCASA